MRLKLVVKHGGLLFIFVNWEDEKRSRPTATDIALKNGKRFGETYTVDWKKSPSFMTGMQQRRTSQELMINSNDYQKVLE